ncbi:MAG TPA: hypothetical protein VKK79_25565 [Candidatus Lokiarchaeia archaeon]|nr:hypothetical protein [Candidatus Lokiarchaeia archaeon]
MDVVNFLTIEDRDDLVLAFSFDEGTRFGVDGYIIQRTPKYEFILLPGEKGPTVDWTDDDERILLTRVEVTPQHIILETTRDTHMFDISKITADEHAEMLAILEKMNFDHAFDFQIFDQD